MSEQHITERAMLMKLSIHQWTGRKHDKRITAEVAQQHGADEKRFRTRKDLVNRDSLAAITSLNSQIQNLFRTKTLPWLDDGARILPSAFYFELNTELKELIHKREAAVQTFLDNYEDYREEARQALNGAFDERDYPHVRRLRRAFAVDLVVFPMPSGKDFRVPLGKAEAEAEIRAQIDEQVQELLAKAMRDPWQRIYDVVAKLAERLNAYAIDPETGKTITTFRDSLVGNIRELGDLLPGLNVTGDSQLDAMRKTLEDTLCIYDADELRDNSETRTLVADRAEKILTEISDFLA